MNDMPAKADRHHLCDDQRFASVPASGPFRQMVPVPFSRVRGVDMNEMPGGADYDELIELAFAVCDGTATDEQIGRVEAILTGDPAAALAYLECLDLHFDLERRGRRSGLDRRAVERIGSGLPTELHVAAISDRSDDGRSQLCPSPRLPTSSSFISRPSPFLLDHVGALAGVLSCYLAIAMMFGAVIRGLDVDDSDRARLAANIAVRRPDGPSGARSPEAASAAVQRGVGTITGMSKCEWLNPGTAPRKADPVFEGCSYNLLSGLLEISYDVGTKAILEGPVVYRVDAGNGGSPFSGKVTVHARKADRPAAGTPTGVIRMRYGQEMMFGGGRAHRKRPGGGGRPPDAPLMRRHFAW